MPTWLPTREADRLVWLRNYALKLSVHLGTAGIVAGDVTLSTPIDSHHAGAAFRHGIRPRRDASLS
jgi:hypothetical protein